jgi:hypothetical protein
MAGGSGAGAGSAAARPPVTVTLVMSHGPGFPGGSQDHRYELRVVLDARGCLDAEAWNADPEPWPIRRLWPGEAPRHGDVHHDPDSGWSLRLFRAEADGPDAPLQALFHSPGPMRPGEYVTIVEADGQEYGYRIVGVG